MSILGLLILGLFGTGMFAFFSITVVFAAAFTVPTTFVSPLSLLVLSLSSAPPSYLRAVTIDYQRDYGRGDHHLSAYLSEDDVVVYQAGTWLVDGVQVGSDSEPVFLYARIETMQLVWTHNCEHGVLRGFPLKLSDIGLLEMVNEEGPQVEFGPEQVICRVPVEWDPDARTATPSVPIQQDMWEPMQ
jgi:hypothetical protein